MSLSRRSCPAWIFVLSAACSRPAHEDPTARGGTATVTSASSSIAPKGQASRVAVDSLVATDASRTDCVFGHRGVLLDLGDPSTRSRLVATRGGRIERGERDGASWARVFGGGASLSFVVSPEDLVDAAADGAAPVIQARLRGGSARSVAVYLNGKAAGVLPLVKGEARVVTLPLSPTGPNAAQLVTGTNELLLRFRGAPRAGASAPDEQAEVDWIHIGGAVEGETYDAPTRPSAIASVSLAGVPMRSLSLRAPGYARCTGWLAAGAHLATSVGVAGSGEADVEIRVLRDRAPPVVLSSLHLSAEAPWRSVDVSTRGGSPKGTLGALELVAVRSTNGARVAFGEPRIVTGAPEVPAAPAPVNGVVLVVLGSVAPRAIDLYSAAGDGATRATAMPELDALARAGTAFDAHRSTSGAASGAVASILTSLSPRADGVADDESALAPGVTTLADVARQAGIRAAMFTSNPTTGSAFGFARGWDTFIEHPPDLAEPPGSAVAPFDDAARWIGEHGPTGGRFLVVVHARGGHPPWDATPEDLRTLAPVDYTGGIDPKRAAELLIRTHAGAQGPRPSPLHLTDADRTRAWALYALALKGHDAALGRLLAALKAAGRDGDTMILVTGDVGVGDARAPLESADPLDESALASPLVIRLPGVRFPTAHVASPTTSSDVARTVVDAFGLTPPAAFRGEDLVALARAGTDNDAPARPTLAVYGGRFALRWGSFVVRGVGPSEDSGTDVTKLCDLSLEPACTSDVRGAFPLALSALRREVSSGVDRAVVPTPVVETPAIRSALRLWGL